MSSVYVKARQARRDNLRLFDVEVNESGTGELLRSGKGAGYAFQPQVRAREMRIDDVPFQNVVLSVRGNTKDDPFTAGGGDWTGKVRFARALLGPLELTDGVGDLVLRDGTATLTALTATANEGRVRVAGDFPLAKGPLRWHGTLEADDVRVTEALGRPLSFLVPIMRLKIGDGRRSLTGLVSARLEFRGVGTTYASLSPSLSGTGSIGLKDIELQGSLLLPLLSLRIDRLLTDRGYRFSDVTIRFGVRGGRVRPDPFELKGEPFGIKLEGDAGLDGSLDFLVDPSLLPVPLRVTGNLDKPKVRPDPLAGLPFR